MFLIVQVLVKPCPGKKSVPSGIVSETKLAWSQGISGVLVAVMVGTAVGSAVGSAVGGLVGARVGSD